EYLYTECDIDIRKKKKRTPKKTPRKRKLSDDKGDNIGKGSLTRKRNKETTPTQERKIIGFISKTARPNITRSTISTRSSDAKNKSHLSISTFAVEIMPSITSNLFINEYSKMSFDSNIKRPFCVNNINYSSA